MISRSKTTHAHTYTCKMIIFKFRHLFAYSDHCVHYCKHIAKEIVQYSSYLLGYWEGATITVNAVNLCFFYLHKFIVLKHCWLALRCLMSYCSFRFEWRLHWLVIHLQMRTVWLAFEKTFWFMQTWVAAALATWMVTIRTSMMWMMHTWRNNRWEQLLLQWFCVLGTILMHVVWCLLSATERKDCILCCGARRSTVCVGRNWRLQNLCDVQQPFNKLVILYSLWKWAIVWCAATAGFRLRCDVREKVLTVVYCALF